MNDSYYKLALIEQAKIVAFNSVDNYLLAQDW